MSKSTLQQALRKIEERVQNRDQQLRKERSNKQSHTAIFNLESITKNLVKEIEVRQGKKLQPHQVQLVRKEALVFCNEVFSKFEILKGKTVTKVRRFGVPTNFTLILTKTGGSPRIFDSALRGSLNPFVGRLESRMVELFNGDPSWSRENNKTQSVLLNLGHETGYSIADQGASLFLDIDEKKALSRIKSEKIKVELEKFGLFDPQRRFIRVSLESSTANQNTYDKEEKGRLVELLNEIKKYFDSIDLAELKGSPSINDEFIRAIRIAAKKGGKIPKNLLTKAASNIEIKQKVREAKFGLSVEGLKEQEPNWASIVNIINSKLEAQVALNMGAPGLVYRTGAFAASARVSSIRRTAEGYPSFGLTYDKTPYGVFDRTRGAAPWNTPERDPNTLIEKSVRQIVQELAIGRFYTRRE